MRLALVLLLLWMLAPAVLAGPVKPLVQVPIDAKWVNPWPDERESAFRERAQLAIDAHTAQGPEHLLREREGQGPAADAPRVVRRADDRSFT